MKVLLPLMLACLVGACASPSPSSTRTAGDMVCRREIPTGSNVPTTKCRTRAEIERDEQGVQSTADDIGRARSGIRGPGN